MKMLTYWKRWCKSKGERMKKSNTAPPVSVAAAFIPQYVQLHVSKTLSTSAILYVRTWGDGINGKEAS